MTPTRPTVLPDSSGDAIYQQFHTYPFSTDSEFLYGLAVLIGQTGSGTPITDAQISRVELELRAKSFYFSKKFSIEPPIDVPSYTAWARRHGALITTIDQTPKTDEKKEGDLETAAAVDANETNEFWSTEAPAQKLPNRAESSTTSLLAVTAPSVSTEPDQNHAQSQGPKPTYPSSFAHIVELITTGQPVPGIQQIPDKVLTGQDTPSTQKRRKKPWEKEKAGQDEVAGDNAA